MGDPNTKTLDEEINALFQDAAKEKHIHSRSKETFDDVAGLWFLGKRVVSTLAEISSQYVVASFLLKAIGLIYQRVRNDYNLPEFDARALTDDDAREAFLKAVDKLKADGGFVEWLEDLLLGKCAELARVVRFSDLQSVSRLGNLADATSHVAEQYVDRQDGDTWVYDAIFQFATEAFEWLKLPCEETEPADEPPIDPEEEESKLDAGSVLETRNILRSVMSNGDTVAVSLRGGHMLVGKVINVGYRIALVNCACGFGLSDQDHYIRIDEIELVALAGEKDGDECG